MLISNYYAPRHPPLCRRLLCGGTEAQFTSGHSGASAGEVKATGAAQLCEEARMLSALLQLLPPAPSLTRRHPPLSLWCSRPRDCLRPVGQSAAGPPTVGSHRYLQANSTEPTSRSPRGVVACVVPKARRAMPCVRDSSTKGPCEAGQPPSCPPRGALGPSLHGLHLAGLDRSGRSQANCFHTQPRHPQLAKSASLNWDYLQMHWISFSLVLVSSRSYGLDSKK